MSGEQRHKELIREYIQECWVEGNLDALDRYVSPDYVEHNPGVQGDIEGIGGHRANLARFKAAFPDMDIEIETLVAEGNKTAQQMTCRGTHEGELMGIPPTETEVEFTATGITVFEDGKMVEDWSQVDMLGVMEQIGVVEAPAD